MTEANVALLVVGVILAVCFALDAWANLRVIRLLEKEDTTETNARKWHV